MKILLTLFKYRLLPSRFSEVLNFRYEVRQSGVWGLFSYFDHIHPDFVAYLEKMGVVYRLGRRKANNGRVDPCLFFWSKKHWDIFQDANNPESIVVENKMLDRFIQELNNLGIAFIQEKQQFGFSYFTIFSTKRMIELMLRFEMVGDGYQTRKLVGF